MGGRCGNSVDAMLGAFVCSLLTFRRGCRAETGTFLFIAAGAVFGFRGGVGRSGNFAGAFVWVLYAAFFLFSGLVGTVVF